MKFMDIEQFSARSATPLGDFKEYSARFLVATIENAFLAFYSVEARDTKHATITGQPIKMNKDTQSTAVLFDNHWLMGTLGIKKAKGIC